MKAADKAATTPFAKLPRTFEGLSRMFLLRPIHDDVDHANATEVIHALAGHRLNEDQADYLEALTTLVVAYEDARHAMDTSHLSGLDSLTYLLDANGMTGADLGRLLGNVSLGGKILRGERELSKAHLRVLAERFKVSPALFL